MVSAHGLQSLKQYKRVYSEETFCSLLTPITSLPSGDHILHQ